MLVLQHFYRQIRQYFHRVDVVELSVYLVYSVHSRVQQHHSWYPLHHVSIMKQIYAQLSRGRGFDTATLLCLPKASIWISNDICGSLFLCSMVWPRGGRFVDIDGVVDRHYF